MKKWSVILVVVFLIFLLSGFTALVNPAALFSPKENVTAKRTMSEWVYPGKDGKLVYKTTRAGDRIMDFSHAGYMGGGVALPVVPVRGKTRKFGGEKAVDGNNTTYWAVDDDIIPATLTLDTEGPLKINALVVGEAMELNRRIREYKIEGQVDSDRILLSKGTSIGKRKVDRFPEATVWKVRLTVLKSEGYPAITRLGLYLEDPSQLKEN